MANHLHTGSIQCTQSDSYLACQEWDGYEDGAYYDGSYPYLKIAHRTWSDYDAGPFWGITRGFISFDTSLLEGVTITSAVLKLYCTSALSQDADIENNVTATNFELVVQNGQPDWPDLPYLGGESVSYDLQGDYDCAAPSFDKVHYFGDGGSIFFEDIGEVIEGGEKYILITLNETGISWINKTGITKFCLRMRDDINATEPMAYSSEQTIELSSYGWMLNDRYSNPGYFYDSGTLPNMLLINGEGGSPVTTLPATGVDYYFAKATLNGTQGGMASVYFKFGLNNPPTGISTSYPAASPFAVTVHHLAQTRTYYFRAAGMDSEGTHYYGDILSFDVVLPIGLPAYITRLRIYGEPLVPLETVTLSVKDDASIALYGKRTYDLSTQYSLSQEDTQIIISEILQDNKDPRVNNLIVKFQNLKIGALKESVIAADISKRITLKNTLLGLDADYFINNIKHSISDAGLSYSVEWRLERIYD